MKKQIWTYCIAEFLFTISHGLMATTYILFLRKIGLSFLEIGIVNIGCIVSHLIFTVPTGIIADRIGRKKSYIIACLVNAVALVLYYFARGFWQALGVEVLGGIGLAFYDGALTALIINKLIQRKMDVNRVLSTSRIVNVTAMIVGGVAGAFIGKDDLGTPFFFCGFFFLVCAVFAWLFIAEEKGDLHSPQGRRDCSIIKKSLGHIREVLHHRIIFPLAMTGFAGSIAMEMFLKMWAPHISPLLKDQSSFGPIWAVMMGCAAIGGVISYRAKRKHFPIMIVVGRSAVGMLLCGCALVSGVAGKVFFVSMLEMVVNATRSISDTEVNQHIRSKDRSAMLSAYSLVCSGGCIVGLFAGVAADHFSIEATWTWGGITASLFSLFFGVIYLRNKKISPDSR